MNEKTRVFTPRMLFQPLAVVVVMPLLPLLITQRWRWWEASAYALIFVLGFVASRALMARKHPDLVAGKQESGFWLATRGAT